MVRRTHLAIILFLLLWAIPQSAHSHGGRIPAIVDTDMALDDIRAIAMLLNSDLVDIELIVTSDGVSSPQVGAQNLETLLRYFNRGDIEIGKGRFLGLAAPGWRAWSENLKWPPMNSMEVPITTDRPAAQAIVDTLKALSGKASYLCLGPLTNLADALQLDPDIKDKISQVLYFGASPHAPFPGWNTDRDRQSAMLVFETDLPILAVVLPNERLLRFDQLLYERIKSVDSTAARLVATTHGGPVVQKPLQEGRFYIWDEMIVMYLFRPSLFEFSSGGNGVDPKSLVSFRTAGFYETYLKLLGRAADFHLNPRRAVLLKSFPTEPSVFKEDVGPYVEPIIAKYGLEEWKACLLTNEFHRHLGTYSLIGAKMGVRAREILEAPFDTMEVVSFAGRRPPLSCLSDGIQVSTGASLGRGTIRLSNQRLAPEASFQYEGKKLTLRLKRKWVDKIEEDLRRILKESEGLNPAYFASVRELSIRYWLFLDRHELFEEIIEEQGEG